MKHCYLGMPLVRLKNLVSNYTWGNPVDLPTLTQRLRIALKENDEYLPDQKAKPTQTPTLIWIFTLFSSITAIHLPQSQRIILNLHPLHEKVICLLGDKAKKIYLIPDDRTHQNIQLNQETWLKWCGI